MLKLDKKQLHFFMPRRKKRELMDYIKLPDLDLDSETKRGIFIVVLLALGLIALLGLFDLAGVWGQYLKKWLALGFGWGKWLPPLIFIALGYILYQEEKYEVRIKNYVGLILFVFSLQAFLALFIDREKWTEMIALGKGGGYVGLALGIPLYKYTGIFVAFILSIALVIISLSLSFNTSPRGLFGPESIFARMTLPFRYVFLKLFGRKRENEEEEEEEEEQEEEEEEEEKDDEPEEEEEEEVEEEQGEEEESEDEPDEEEEEAEFRKKKIKEEAPDVWWKPSGIEIGLPMSLLDSSREKPTSGDIKDNQEIIKKTLANFGIPVEMGEISVGPTVTQYTLKPADGVKLSRITNLSNDLALALAMHPIRIEAPIPGKSLVGVEVPNQRKANVTLKEVFLSEAYKERKSALTIALGKDVAGKGWVGDITKMPHLLVAGATNSGKSVCLNSIIVSLLYQNNPDDLRLIMVDPKRVEMQPYNGIPHLLTPVITDVGKTINALKWCLNEMDKRFDILSSSGKRDIKSYNENAKMKMPYIIFIIDELADLMVAAQKDIESGVIRLSQMARAVGIHLILATQRPSVNIITGVIKANMPARAAFSVASSMDSRTILDTMGAEKLLGRGDMLYANAEMSKPVRLQGAFVGDQEIKKIVRFIKDRSKGKTLFVDNVTDRQQRVNGIGGYGLDKTGGDGDDMYEEAKQTVIESGKASASFLQRKLRVGYARAASLLDSMQAEGLIGPAVGSKPREILVSREQFLSLSGTAVSGMPLHRRSDARKPDEFLEEDDDIPPVFRKDNDDDDQDEDEDAQEEKNEDTDNDDEDNNDEDEAVENEEEKEDEEENEDEDEDEGNDDSDDEQSDEDEAEEEEEVEEEVKKPIKKEPKDVNFNKFFSR
jgi:S-DNA-T family DNA segregation ATPase FtsK/SpoIIIE